MSIIIRNTWWGYRTKDATALPDNVEDGKVFYNADGRQVGTGVFKKVKSVIAINNGTYPIAGNYPFRFLYKEDGGIDSAYSDVDFKDKSVKCKVNLPENVIITDLGINGKKIKLNPPISNRFGSGEYGYPFVVYYNRYPSSESADLKFYWINANYSGGIQKGFYVLDASKHSLEIFYIELE